RSTGKIIMFTLLALGFIVASYFGVRMLRTPAPDSSAVVDSLAADSVAPAAPAASDTTQQPLTSAPPRTP
ncbi:MAG TPA: hypothetical protein VM733_13655, partial [Thermoanaerobaculia bacterium]|nr:hypothetical protein [Thermoanaerobaculia bacterium]